MRIFLLAIRVGAYISRGKETEPQMTNFETFLATFDTPLAQGRARTALEFTQQFNRFPSARHLYAEQNLADFERVDYAKGRVYKKSGAFFAIKDTTNSFADYVQFLLDTVTA